MKKFVILLILLLFTTGVKAVPDLRTYKIFQANSLFNRKQYEAAIKTYKEILLTSLDENEKITCLKGIAEGYYQLGNFDDAVKEYEILIKSYPELPEINALRERLAELYQIKNNPDKQLELLREMAEKDPFNVNYIFLIGRFFENRNSYDKAQDIYERKLDLLPSNFDLHDRLFRVYEKRNILEEKIKNLENELNRSPGNNDTRRLLVNFYLWQKKYSRAISVWEKNPDKDLSYFETLGNLHFESDNKNEAISIWKNIFIQNPNEQTLQTAVAILNKKNLLNESLICFLKARELFSSPVIYHREIFEIYLLQTRAGQAFEELLNLLNYSPQDLPLVISELYEVIKITEDPNLLIEKTKAEILKKPGSGEFYQLLGEIYLETNQPDLSISCFEKAGEFGKNKEIALAQLGEKLINKKFFKEAIKTFTKIKDVDMFKPLANYQIALSFYNLGNYDSSADILNEIINENMPEPYFSGSHALKGEIYFETHNLPQAKETLSYFVNLPGQNETVIKALSRLAEIEFLLGNFDSAKDQFQAFVNNKRFETFSSSANFYIAETYFLKDEFEKAKAFFEDFAKRFPSEPEANKTLLRLVLLNKNKENETELKVLTGIIREKNSYKLPSAENDINAFISKNPGSKLLVYFLMELGEIYSLENKWPEALKIYEQIKTADSYFYKQEAVKQLAGIYENNFKDTGKARAEYIKLLTDFPDNPVIEIIRKKIEELKP